MKKLLVLAALTLGTTFASTIAMTTSGGASAGLGNSLTFGWSFTVSQPTITVTSLGYYDEGQDGLNTDHEVGLFDSNGTLLVSTVVLSGTSGSTLSNGFRMASITPVSLAAGTYMIAGFNPTGSTDRAPQNASLTTAPGISLINGYIYTSAPGFALPQNIVNNNTLISANFEFTDTPEPSTMLLSLGAFAALGLKKRFSKQA